MTETEAVRRCNTCTAPATCSEFGRCPLDSIRAETGEAEPPPRCWDCGASYAFGEGHGDEQLFCSEVCADAYRAELGA